MRSYPILCPAVRDGLGHLLPPPHTSASQPMGEEAERRPTRFARAAAAGHVRREHAELLSEVRRIARATEVSALDARVASFAFDSLFSSSRAWTPLLLSLDAFRELPNPSSLVLSCSFSTTGGGGWGGGVLCVTRCSADDLAAWGGAAACA